MEMLNILNVILIILVLLVFGLGMTYLFIIFKGKKKEEKKDEQIGGEKSASTIDFSKESIHKFMEFDEIVDNMIVRKNRSQYIMVIQCHGINYDLMSEAEKISVEEGFVQFLNTLRFPIQLYIQTRSLNLRDIIDEYKERVNTISQEINTAKSKLEQAKLKGDLELVQRLEFDIRRKSNVLEYGLDISEYVGRMSLNKNVLQQKTYVIVSYFASEIGSVSNYSKEEIDNLCFSELYTRCQSVLHSLAPSEVTGKVLDSEELAELLYVAYNRDDSEIMQLSKALDAGFDSLYSTSRDTLEKRQEVIEEQITEQAVNIVTQSIYAADEVIKLDEETKKKKVKERAIEILEQYEDQMDEKLYEETKKQLQQEETPKKKKMISKVKDSSTDIA